MTHVELKKCLGNIEVNNDAGDSNNGQHIEDIAANHVSECDIDTLPKRSRDRGC